MTFHKSFYVHNIIDYISLSQDRLWNMKLAWSNSLPLTTSQPWKNWN